MIRAQEYQTLLDIAIQETGTALSVFDYALKNGVSITDGLATGQNVSIAPKKSYETNLFYELIEKYTDKRQNTINVIESQSLLDIAIQEDGCVLAVFDWALNNDISVTDFLVPGKKIKMPKSETFRYNEIANHFKNSNTNVATFFIAVKGEIEYYLPGEFPFSF
jgi:hypothetical protein